MLGKGRSGHKVAVPKNTERSAKPQWKAGNGKGILGNDTAYRQAPNANGAKAKIGPYNVPLCSQGNNQRSIVNGKRLKADANLCCQPRVANSRINYCPMEKLILALVHATRRLRRCFQAYTIMVITYQPIKQILSRPKNTGRMAKWTFELGAYDIRPRTSIRHQIWADFIAKRSDENDPPAGTSTEEEILEP
ncbi:reverse transcriptase domain-containing protein, partial [Tanacetum coccineum]